MFLELNLQNVLVLISAELAVFGWRIVREISLAEANRRVWFPINDYMNLLGAVSLLIFCVVLPLSRRMAGISAAYAFLKISNAVFSVALVMLVFYPISMIAHYGLLNRKGRDRFLRKDRRAYPYCPTQEWVVYGVGIICAAGSFVLVYMR